MRHVLPLLAVCLGSSLTTFGSGCSSPPASSVDGAVADAASPLSDGRVDAPPPSAELGPRLDGSDPLAAFIQRLTPRQRVGQLLFARYAASCAQIAELQPGGVVYHGSDVTTEGALRQANLALQRCAQTNGLSAAVFASTNHEGGRVHYFEAPSQVTRFPSAKLQCDRGTDYVYQVSRAQAEELLYTGIDVTLGPDADVLVVGSNVIGDRAYASDPKRAADCVTAALRGYHEGKVLTTLKHFPGHGGTASDTHLGLAVDPSSVAALEQTHLVPFWQGLRQSPQAAFVMVSHVVYRAIDPSWPATLSPAVVALLRGRQDPRFAGVTVTDDLNMQAITRYWPLEQAAALSLLAGADMLMTGTVVDAVKARDLLVKAWDGGLELNVKDLTGASRVVKATAQEVQTRVNDALARILAVKQRAGLLDLPAAIQRLEQAPVPDWAAHRKLATQ